MDRVCVCQWSLWKSRRFASTFLFLTQVKRKKPFRCPIRHQASKSGIRQWLVLSTKNLWKCKIEGFPIWIRINMKNVDRLRLSWQTANYTSHLLYSYSTCTVPGNNVHNIVVYRRKYEVCYFGEICAHKEWIQNTPSPKQYTKIVDSACFAFQRDTSR